MVRKAPMLQLCVMKICSTCGTQYPANDTLEVCAICADDRQYIPEGGQVWTTPEALRKGHSVRIAQVAAGVFDLTIVPTFAIGQRALLVGNVLWDCIPLLDEGLKAFTKGRGGLEAIAFSHPHYYSNMNEWAEASIVPSTFTKAMPNGSFTRGSAS